MVVVVLHLLVEVVYGGGDGGDGGGCGGEEGANGVNWWLRLSTVSIWQLRGLAIAVCDGTDDGGVRRYCYFNSGALPPRSSHDVYHVDDD